MTQEHEFDPFAGGELLRVSPTTASQHEIITAAKMSDEANTAYNEAIVLHVDGSLDIQLLKKCFDALLERHELLRTTFSPAGDKLCLQEPGAVSFDYEDLRDLENDRKKLIIDTLLKNIALAPMNLEEGPLFFVWVKQLEDACYQVIIAAHHLICDGWSYGILLKELVKLYAEDGNPDILGKAPSFYNYAEEEAAATVKNIDADFWLDLFEDLPPTLDLPLDRPRPARRSFTAARADYRLKKSIVERLPKAASTLQSSKVNYVLAAYFSLLHRLTGNEDIVVGLPLAGQAAFGRFDLFGHMVQLIPIRLKFSRDTTYAELVKMVRNEVLKASEHPNFTYGRLLEKFTVDRSRVPIINTIFNIDQPTPPVHLGSATAVVKSVPRAAESFEIFLNIVPSETELLLEVTYSQALFSETTISAWMHALESILQNAIENHHVRLSDLQLSAETPEVIDKLNKTDRDTIYSDVISAFMSQKEKTPDATAVICDEYQLTYAQLDQSSSQLAQHLFENGVREGAVVGICCRRSERLLLSTLAVFKLGAAYLPLDPDFPGDRLEYMIDDSGSAAIIEDDYAPQRVKAADVSHINLDSMKDHIPIIADLPKLLPKNDRLGYIIYTSGSTGQPKGVNVQNGAIINFLESMAKTPGFTGEDRLLAVTTLSFDISVLELFLPLMVGGTVIIANSDDYKDGERLAALIDRHRITVMQATPSTWRLLLNSSWTRCNQDKEPSLKALCGGEPLPQSLATELLPQVKELWNMYGPTETTVWSTCRKVDPSDPFISIGPPIANTRIHILDGNLNPLPVSVPGELCIGGRGVTLGYHNRPELNIERFVDHPMFGRIYRTGDIAKIHCNGEIQHLGRMDDQVKLRGYRIELGEIETALTNCEGVSQAAAYLWNPSDDDFRIIACCVPENTHHLATVQLRKQLRSILPAYMIPQYLLTIDKLPLTPNGKIDRKSLPRPEVNESSVFRSGSLHTESEKHIAAIWQDVLKLTVSISREDNFFELGGHSLLALETIRRIEIATGIRLEFAQILTENLQELAIHIGDSNTLHPDRDGPATLPHPGPRHLSKEQRRLLKRQLKYPNNCSDNLPAAWQLEGELDLESFYAALKRLLQRQTALRTIITEDADDYFLNLQHISDIKFLDLKDFSGRDNPVDDAIRDAAELTEQPFDVLKNLLWRMRLYKLGPDCHLFVFIPHQLIFDGWSFDIFLTELEAFYKASREAGTASLNTLNFQFSDFAEWSFNHEPDPDTVRYHKRTLELHHASSVLIDLGKERRKCARKCARIPVEKLRMMESFCEKHQLRLHELIFAALAQEYGYAIEKEEFIICLPVTGRYSPDVMELIGSFISILPVKIRLSKEGFVEKAKETAEQLRVFYQNQEISFAQLVENTPLQHNFFPSLLPLSFAYQDIRNRSRNFADLNITQVNISRQHTVFPLEFWSRVEEDGVLIVLDYDTGQVDTQLVDSLLINIFGSLNELERITREASTAESEQKSSSQKKNLWRHVFQN